MKYLFLSIVIALASCTNSGKDPAPGAADTARQKESKLQKDISKYHTNHDTIIAGLSDGCDFRYSKEAFNQIVDQRPEFFDEFIKHPDLAYYCNPGGNNFGSEVGQDSYYVLYAYFLRQRNGLEKYSTQRKKLIDIYRNINHLFGMLHRGGTYFGHQHCRILGYAEFGVYQFARYYSEPEKTYDIAKQKELYIQSLRQLVDDEASIDNEVMGKEKAERKKDLNKIVEELEKLITDHFYLQQARGFQYEHYVYY